jgi:serine phosphatase RsbU (regulator of sigma subunit)/anti-sigma regulatory factor (Ser/Thr protein kinase)
LLANEKNTPNPLQDDTPDREQLLEQIKQQQAQLEEQQLEIDDYTEQVDKMHFLQEMLETSGAELNISHQKLLESSRQLKQTRDKLEIHQQEMQDNFDVARRIVEELFPFSSFRSGYFSLFGQTNVANDLSGDFFAILNERPGMMTAILADVSGHGLPAAMILMMTRLLLNTFSSSSIMLRDLLLLTHNELFDNIPRGSYIAFGLLDINLKSGMIRYGIGGLYAGLVLRPGEERMLQLPTNNYALAFKEDTTFEDSEFQLLPGDKLILFTDGLLETVDASDSFLGLEPIQDLLVEQRHLTGHGLRRLLFEKQHEFAGNTPIRDDTSVMILEEDSEPIFETVINVQSTDLSRRLAKLAPAIEWCLNDKKLVKQLHKVLKQAIRNGVESCERNQLQVDVQVQIFRNYRQLKIRVTDTGPGFKQTVPVTGNSDRLDPGEAGGRGFTIYHQILDEIYLNEKGNEFNLVKYLEEDDYGD